MLYDGRCQSFTVVKRFSFRFLNTPVLNAHHHPVSSHPQKGMLALLFRCCAIWQTLCWEWSMFRYYPCEFETTANPTQITLTPWNKESTRIRRPCFRSLRCNSKFVQGSCDVKIDSHGACKAGAVRSVYSPTSNIYGARLACAQWPCKRSADLRATLGICSSWRYFRGATDTKRNIPAQWWANICISRSNPRPIPCRSDTLYKPLYIVQEQQWRVGYYCNPSFCVSSTLSEIVKVVTSTCELLLSKTHVHRAYLSMLSGSVMCQPRQILTI